MLKFSLDFIANFAVNCRALTDGKILSPKNGLTFEGPSNEKPCISY